MNCNIILPGIIWLDGRVIAGISFRLRYLPVSGDALRGSLGGGQDEKTPPTISVMRRALSLPERVPLHVVYSGDLCDNPAATTASQPAPSPDRSFPTRPGSGETHPEDYINTGYINTGESQRIQPCSLNFMPIGLSSACVTVKCWY